MMSDTNLQACPDCHYILRPEDGVGNLCRACAARKTTSGIPSVYQDALDADMVAAREATIATLTRERDESQAAMQEAVELLIRAVDMGGSWDAIADDILAFLARFPEVK